MSEALGLKRSLAFHLDDINKRHGVLGATMAVALGKSRVVELAVGTDAKGGKLHTRSLFAVASVTKLATALLTLRMVEQGKLDLKADVRQYLPAHLAWPGDKVTITHLLTHTAGVKRDDPDRVDRAWVRSAYRCVRTAPSNPGQFFSYADCDYEVLGMTIQTVHALGFRRALSSEVLKPLGMRGTLWGGKRRVARLNGGFSSLYRPLRLRRHQGTSAAGLITDAVGAMRLARAFGGEDELLDPKLVRLAASDQTHAATSKDDICLRARHGASVLRSGAPRTPITFQSRSAKPHSATLVRRAASHGQLRTGASAGPSCQHGQSDRVRSKAPRPHRRLTGSSRIGPKSAKACLICLIEAGSVTVLS